MSPPPRPEPAPLTVLYDGARHLCSREIAWCRRRAGAEPIRRVDLRRAPTLPAGISRTAALARFQSPWPWRPASGSAVSRTSSEASVTWA